jgi:hypothetical protein
MLEEHKKEFEWQRHLLYQILISQEEVMSALANAQAALAQLKADVEAFINNPPPKASQRPMYKP